MNSKELNKKSIEWCSTLEDILIEINDLKDARDLRFCVDINPPMYALIGLIGQCQKAIRTSEMTLETEKNALANVRGDINE